MRLYWKCKNAASGQDDRKAWGNEPTLKSKNKQTIITLLAIILLSIIYTHKLLRYCPWIGADTQPVYPYTTRDLLLFLTSPWDFYLSRTVINIKIPYITYLKDILYIIFERYAEYIITFLWLVIAGYGFYRLTSLLRAPWYSRLLGSLIYTFSSFTYSQSVHSIYGMMGAYAITPYIYIILVKIIQLLVNKDHLRQIAESILVGTFLGIISISTLFAYYGIFLAFIWLPLFISQIVFSTKHPTMKAKGLAALVLIALGFLATYLYSYIMMQQLAKSEQYSVKSSMRLFQVKIADFSYNYRFNNLPLVLWIIYPWSSAARLPELKQLTVVLVYIMTLSIVAYIILFKKQRNNIEFIDISILIGIVMILLYITVATYIAQHQTLLKIFWNIKPIAIILSSIAQPIKVGIVASLFESLLLVRVLGLRVERNKCIYYLINLTKVLIIVVFIVIFIIYTLKMPIRSNNYVPIEYKSSLQFLIKNQRATGFSYVGVPYVYIDDGKDFFRYYYTYGFALRPFTPYGPYIKHLNLEKEVQRYLHSRRIVASIIAKSLYIGIYIDKEHNLHTYSYKKSLVYIVLPIIIKPWQPDRYLDSMFIVAKLIASNQTLARCFLDSFLVLDAFPPDYNFTNAIQVVFIKSYNKVTNITNTADIMVITDKDDKIKEVKYDASVIRKIQKLIDAYCNTKITTAVRFIPFSIYAKLKIIDNNRPVILRLNEHYSQYFACEGCRRLPGLLFNIFMLVQTQKNPIEVEIMHKAYGLKVFSTSLALFLTFAGLYLIIKYNQNS